MRFSVSRLKTFQDCQLRGRFKYVDCLPDEHQSASASFGSVVHKALESFNTTGNVERAVELFKDLWENPEKIGVAPTYWPKGVTYAGMRERGIFAIENYASVCKWDDREVIAVEHEFLVPFGEHELYGFIDLLDVRRSGKGKDLLRVEDFKTNRKKPKIAELVLDVQFTGYTFATHQPEFWETLPNGKQLYERFKDKPRRNIWFQVMDGVEIDAGSRDEDDFKRLYRLCDEVQRAHDANVFVPRIGEACTYCPFTAECGIHIPTQAELREQEHAWM